MFDLINQDYEDIIDKGIFISGSARSGTTIIGKLISTLSNVEYFYEPLMAFPIMLNNGIKNSKKLLEIYLVENLLIESMAGRNFNFNENDDSCIYNSKSKKEIDEIMSKSYVRKELEEKYLKVVFSMKQPDIIWFLRDLRFLYPNTNYVLMHRNPNDVINSLKRKGWFSSENLQKINLTPQYPKKIIDNIKIPHWVKQEDEIFWLNTDEINRCGYYYKRVSEEVLENAGSSIIINYEEFIEKPNEVFRYLVKLLGLEFGEKTEEILSTVQYQYKHREDYLEGLDGELLSAIENLDEKLKASSFYMNPVIY
jgi:hypothetical protein